MPFHIAAGSNCFSEMHTRLIQLVTKLRITASVHPGHPPFSERPIDQQMTAECGPERQSRHTAIRSELFVQLLHG